RSSPSSSLGSAGARATCLSHQRSAPQWARKTVRAGPRRRWSTPPLARSPRAPWARAASANAAAVSVSSLLSARASTPHEPGCSTIIQRWTREAVAISGSPCLSESAAQRSPSRSATTGACAGVGSQDALPDQPPHQDPATLGVEQVGQVGDPHGPVLHQPPHCRLKLGGQGPAPVAECEAQPPVVVVADPPGAAPPPPPPG